MPNNPIELEVPAAHPCYADHFPGDPLVPGALLLQWIEARLREVLPGLAIGEIRSAKFFQAVRPGVKLTLFWERKAGDAAVIVDCRCGEQTACKVHLIAAAG